MEIIKAPASKIQKWIEGEKATLEELYGNIEEQAYSSNLAMILNQEPNKKWIKEHPFAKNVKYISIEKLEFMMSYFFGEWHVELLREGILANSLYAAVRVHYKHPKGEWRWSDGIGAVPIQIAKGAAATDFTQMNSSAVQIGLPAAESYAFKDAVEKLGRIFGKDLNRKDLANYAALFGTEQNPRFTENMLVEAPNLGEGEILNADGSPLFP